jgi:hypothetical protein
MLMAIMRILKESPVVSSRGRRRLTRIPMLLRAMSKEPKEKSAPLETTTVKVPRNLTIKGE